MIENLVVEPTCQGKGVGVQLFDYAEATCKAHNCREILLLSSVRRIKAHEFFEQRGFAHVAKGFKKYI